MGPQFLAMSGAAGWQVSNPPILSAAPLLASLEIFTAAGMSALRAKSINLTASLETLLLRHCGAAIEIVTPADPEQRGCQLSVRIKGDATRARESFAQLSAQGVAADWREPDIVRLAATPLYNRYEDVYQAAVRLGEIVR
jgi:kynureninase